MGLVKTRIDCQNVYYRETLIILKKLYLRDLWHFSLLKKMYKFSFLINLTPRFSIPDSFVLSLFYNLTVLGACFEDN